MAFLFACCDTNKKKLPVDAETRRARIVSVYNNSRNASRYSVDRTNSILPPPKYSDAMRDQVVYTLLEEKNPKLFMEEQSTEQRTEPRSLSPAPTFSDESSVVSIPSTRLSGVTSTYTGRTLRLRRRLGDASSTSQRNSWRDSGAYSESASVAPPSYYANSEYNSDLESHEPHPVMQSGWLERLRTEAELRDNATRDTRE